MILGLSAATAAVAATGAVSSFAWFATNDTVTADGMKIKADTNQMLEIKNAIDPATSFSTSASTGKETKSLTPTHLGTDTTDTTISTVTNYSNEAKHSWLAASADKSDASAKKGDYSVVTTAADSATDAGNKYTLIADFDIRVRYAGDTSTTYTLKASVDWVNTTWDDDKVTISSKDYWLHNSARVFLVVGTAGNVESQAKGYVFSSTADGTSGDWNGDKTTIMDSLKQSDDGDDGKGLGVRVRAFFYFDGEDANCFTDSAAVGIKAGLEYSFKLSFDVEKNAA